MASTKCEEIATLAHSGETVGVELKSKLLLKERTPRAGFALAAEIVAMTNRRGGRILVGIDNASRQIEPGNVDDHDAVAQWVSRICHDRCSPPVLIEHDFVSCREGEVLVLRVPRRTGVPHAAVGKIEGGTSGRAYYLRTNEGKQLATEVELTHMFQSTEFPEIERRFVLGYVYHRPGRGGSNSLSLVRPGLRKGVSHPRTPVEKAIQQIELAEELFPEPPAMFHLRALLQACSYGGIGETDKEPEVMVALLRDAFPYALLNYLSWRADLGWATKSDYGLGAVATKFQSKSYAMFRPEDVIVPGPDSIISRACPDFAKSFREFGLGGAGGGVRLPPETEVGIRLASDGQGEGSTLSFSSPGKFSLHVTTRGGPWNVGIPLGHPLRRATGTYILDAEDSRGTVFASVHLRGSTDIVGTSAEDDYFAWLARMAEGIVHGFDYNAAQRSLPDHHILRIEMMVSEMLDRLRNPGPAPDKR